MSVSQRKAPSSSFSSSSSSSTSPAHSPMLSDFPFLRRLAIVAFCILSALPAGAETAREIINKAVLTEDAEEQEKIVSSLVGNPSPEIPALFAAWKESLIYIYELPKSAAEDAPKERVAIL